MKNRSDARWYQDLYRKHRLKILVAQGLVLVAFGFLIARGFSTPPSDGNGTAVTSVAAGPSMWTCSMHPQIRSPKPGKCPICGMDLIPVTQTAGGMRTLTVSPEAMALMGVEVTPVERRYVTHAIPMVGKVDYDETKLGYITAWVGGRLDRLYVDFTGVEVKKGDHMVYIYSEELFGAQEELIQALKYARPRPGGTTRLGIGDINLVESAREKLQLLGLTEDQIKKIETTKKPTDHLTIYSPVSGIVIEKLRQEGERVRLGDRIYTIADLNQVWVQLDAYESDLPWIRYGQDVTITTEAYPGEKFHGRIAFIQPVLNDKTRTVEVRVNVPNAEKKLKPGMFVHAIVQPTVAAGGRVMDANLTGKWISPMHPEIVKDGPGECDVCGMPLVRAESLGYVTAGSDETKPPLVIPYLAALVTGRRAIVYVELPSMDSAAEPAFKTLSTVVKEGELKKIRGAFAKYGRMLDRPYNQPGTDYAKTLWNGYADLFGQDALAGQRVRSTKEAKQILARIERVMNEAREQFAPLGQPTFEGREIVLGPRAGNYYLVRHGLDAGELVVIQGNFKIDAEIQLQAKPSMMTPEGGGTDHSGHKMTYPSEFYEQIRNLESAYDAVVLAIEQGDAQKSAASFSKFGETVKAVNSSLLTGDPRMVWKEFRMLLGNDAAEGSDVTNLADADRVYLLLKGHMRRMREQMGVAQEPEQEVEQIAVGSGFQTELAKLWKAYLPIQQALAADDLGKAQKAWTELESTLTSINAKSLDGSAQKTWDKEKASMTKILADSQATKDLRSLRTAFGSLSRSIGVLAKTFGFGKSVQVFELHCPMAFEGKGATWYQDHDQTRNPFFGSEMLGCSDGAERVVRDEPAKKTSSNTSAK